MGSAKPREVEDFGGPPLAGGAADCRRARDGFVVAALAGGADAAAAAHLASCAACRAHLDAFGRALESGAAEAITCAECRARFPALLLASGGRRDADQPVSEAEGLAARHLAACPDCRAELAAATAVLSGLAAGTLVEPPTLPAVDTRFLHPQPAPTGASWSSKRLALAGLAMLLLCLLSAGLYRTLPIASLPRSELVRPTLPHAAAVRPSASPVLRRSGPLAAGPAAATRSAVGAPGPGPATAGRSGPTAGPDRLPVPGATPQVTLAPRAAPPGAIASAPPPTALPTDAAPGPSSEPPEPRETPLPSATARPALVERCVIERPGFARVLAGACGGFPAVSEHDLYRIEVPTGARWAFSTCGRSQIDTLLALYPAGGFDPAVPCQGLLAFDDDACGRQSHLELDLSPGSYLLVVAEKTGDVAGPYALAVWSSGASASCPGLAPPGAGGDASPTPSAPTPEAPGSHTETPAVPGDATPSPTPSAEPGPPAPPADASGAVAATARDGAAAAAAWDLSVAASVRDGAAAASSPDAAGAAGR